jgi:hypothetical protein
VELLGSDDGEDVDVGLLGCIAVWTCRRIPTFRRNIPSPSSGMEMERVCSSETLYLPTREYAVREAQ